MVTGMARFHVTLVWDTGIFAEQGKGREKLRVIDRDSFITSIVQYVRIDNHIFLMLHGKLFNH